MFDYFGLHLRAVVSRPLAGSALRSQFSVITLTPALSQNERALSPFSLEEEGEDEGKIHLRECGGRFRPNQA